MTIMQDPATKTVAVTPSDSAELGPVRGLYIGVGGDVSIMAHGDTSPVVHKGAATGAVLPIRAKRVYATGTTATDIVAWY